MDFLIALLFNISLTSGIVLEDFGNDVEYPHSAYAICDLYFTPESTPFTFFVGMEESAVFAYSPEIMNVKNKEYARAGVLIEAEELTLNVTGKIDRNENAQLELIMNIDTRK